MRKYILFAPFFFDSYFDLISLQIAVPKSVVRCPPFPKQFCGKDLTSSLLLGEGIGKRGGAPQGHQDVRASHIYTHTRYPRRFIAVLKVFTLQTH